MPSSGFIVIGSLHSVDSSQVFRVSLNSPIILFCFSSVSAAHEHLLLAIFDGILGLIQCGCSFILGLVTVCQNSL